MPHAAPPSIITFRFGKRLVWVATPESCEQAIEFAQKEFAPELGGIDRTCISFTMESGTRSVQIGRMAWNAIMVTLNSYAIIDICVQRDGRHSAHTAEDGLPPYTSDPYFSDVKRSTGSRCPSPSSQQGIQTSSSADAIFCGGPWTWLMKHFDSDLSAS